MYIKRLNGIPGEAIDRLAHAVEKYHWLKIDPIDGVPELYLDNHMMALFRGCQGRFDAEIMQGIYPRGRFWSLEFGVVLHDVFQWYYPNFRHEAFQLQDLLDKAKYFWHKAELDYFSDPKLYDFKFYKGLGGLDGFIGLIIQYFARFHGENERLRIIGTELYFGKGKEVPLLSDPTKYWWAPFRLYLCGMIDMIVDDGIGIGPMDHKSGNNFQGKDPQEKFNVQEGMTGYVLAGQYLLKHFPEVKGRKCDKIWMNHIQVMPTEDPTNRFKRVQMFKTQWQLEEYRQRQIATASQIFNLITTGQKPNWNTDNCNDWYHAPCAFKTLHRQNSEDNVLINIEAHYVRKPIWDPENRESHNAISAT